MRVQVKESENNIFQASHFLSEFSQNSKNVLHIGATSETKNRILVQPTSFASAIDQEHVDRKSQKTTPLTRVVTIYSSAAFH